MTGFRLQFDASELDIFAEAFQRMSEADKGELLDVIGEVIVGQTLWHFDQQMGPDGRWKPSERAKATGGKTLQDKGHLRDSIVPEISELSSSVSVGSNLVYAAIHQWGGIVNDYVALDARTYLYLTDEEHAEITGIAQDFYAAFIP